MCDVVVPALPAGRRQQGSVKREQQQQENLVGGGGGGEKGVCDSRILVMTGRWLPWSFRYAALKPSRETRMRGGLEKLGGHSEKKEKSFLVWICFFICTECQKHLEKGGIRETSSLLKTEFINKATSGRSFLLLFHSSISNFILLFISLTLFSLMLLSCLFCPNYMLLL